MISAYLVDDITIIKSGGTDSWNEPLASSEKAVKGLINYKTKLVRNLKGEEVVSTASVLFHEDINTALGRALSYEDLLKFDGIEHVIIKVGKPKTMGFSGLHFEVDVE